MISGYEEYTEILCRIGGICDEKDPAGASQALSSPRGYRVSRDRSFGHCLGPVDSCA